jgi:CDP-glucose 4,6-dehydratase
VLEPLSGYLTLAIKLAKEEDFHGEDFNFGPSFNSSSFPVKRLIADLYKQWPTKILDTPFTIEGGSFKEAGLLKLNCDKALHLLDWFPACTYEETISMVADWYHNFYQSSGDMMELTNAQIEFYEKLGFNRGCVWAGNE